MTSSQLKPMRSRGSDLRPSRSLEPIAQSVADALDALWAKEREHRSPHWRPNQRDQSDVYRAHCQALRASRRKRRKDAAPAQPWSPELSDRELERREQLRRIAKRKADKRARNAI